MNVIKRLFVVMLIVVPTLVTSAQVSASAPVPDSVCSPDSDGLANYPPSSVVSAHQIDSDDDETAMQSRIERGTPTFAGVLLLANDCVDDVAASAQICGTAGSFDEYPPTSLESAQRNQSVADCTVAKVSPTTMACAPDDEVAAKPGIEGSIVDMNGPAMLTTDINDNSELASLPSDNDTTGLLEFGQFAPPVHATESGGSNSGSGGSC